MAQHTFSCLDGHTCGNPVRLVSGGAPLLKGATMSERRLDFLANYDWIRKALMFEPRGHDVMSGSIVYPPTRADCDIGVELSKRNTIGTSCRVFINAADIGLSIYVHLISPLQYRLLSGILI